MFLLIHNPQGYISDETKIITEVLLSKNVSSVHVSKSKRQINCR